MLIGKRFRLGRATLALDLIEGKSRALTLPAGAILTVAKAPHGEHPNAMVDVLWEGREVTMFVVDVDVRATEIDSQASTSA